MQRYPSNEKNNTLCKYSKPCPENKFPPLSGNYSVGFQGKTIISKRKDIFHNKKQREIFLSIFYPAKKEKKQKKRLTLDSLFPTSEEIGGFRTYYFPLIEKLSSIDNPEKSSVFTSTLYNYLKELYKTLELNTIPMASPLNQVFPVVFFTPGTSATTHQYAGLLEQIASHGIIIIGVDHPHWEGDRVIYHYDKRKISIYTKDDLNQDEHKDANVLKSRVFDIKEAIDNLNNLKNDLDLLIDHSKISIIGHSYGGHTAFLSTRYIKGLHKYINLDGSFSVGDEENDMITYNLSDEHTIYLCATENFTGSIASCDEEIESLGDTIKKFKHFEIRYMHQMYHSDFSNIAVFKDYSPIFYNDIRSSKAEDLYNRIIKIIVPYLKSD